MTTVSLAKFGNKEFEVIAMNIETMMTKLTVDETVQRKLDKAHAKRLTQYYDACLMGDIENAFTSPLVATKRADGMCYINDGQHRYTGLSNLVSDLAGKIVKLKSKLNNKKLDDAKIEELQFDLRGIEYKYKRIKEWKVPVMVFHGLSILEERQLFHDLNNNAKKPSSSLSLTYDSANAFTRIAKEVVEENEVLAGMIEWGAKTSEGKMLFSNVYNASLRFLGNKKTDKVTEETYDEKKNSLARFFEIYLETLPKDWTSEEYIYNLAPTIQGIAQFSNFIINESNENKNIDWETTLEETLKTFEMKHSNPLFNSIGGLAIGSDGKLATKGTGGTITAVFSTLKGSAKVYGFDGKIITNIDRGAKLDEDAELLSADETALDESVIASKLQEEAQAESASASEETASVESQTSAEKGKKIKISAEKPTSEEETVAPSLEALDDFSIKLDLNK